MSALASSGRFATRVGRAFASGQESGLRLVGLT